MSEHIEKAPNVPPFVTFVTSTVPMVFDNSLSYYEALSALWKWLQDDVVNVINNNATVTEDYIQLTNEMKEYMDSYFDNLDVQEEINNKLDEMASNGELQQIIADYFVIVDQKIEAQNQEIDTFETGVNNIVNTQNTSIQQLIARMDTFSSLSEGSTTGDAELADGRVAFTGRVYSTIGDNIRKYQGVMFTNIMSDAGTTYSDEYYYPSSLTKTSNSSYECWTFKTRKGHLYIVDTNAVNNPKNVVLGYALTVPAEGVTGAHEDPIVFIGNGATVAVNNLKAYTTPFIGELKSDTNDFDELSLTYTDITSGLSEVSGKYITATGSEASASNRAYYAVTPKAGHYYIVNTAVSNAMPICYQENGCIYPNDSGSYGNVCQGEYKVYSNNTNTLYFNLDKNRLLGGTFKVYESRQSYGVGEITLPIEPCKGAFDKVVFIGDSLTRGSTFTSNSTSYVNYYNYVHFLTELWGIKEPITIASGGYTTQDWWNRYQNDLNQENCLYIVWLGTNGGLTDTVATDCAGNDYTQFADTNTGDYGKIIGKIKSLNNTKVLLVNIFRTNQGTTNKAISDIATKYGCQVIDTYKDIVRSAGYHTAYNGYHDNIHFNSQGYNLIANLITQQLSKYMNAHAGEYEIYKVKS